MVDRPSIWVGEQDGISRFAGRATNPHTADHSHIVPEFELLGGWGRHFAMYAARNIIAGAAQATSTYSASFGYLHADYPTAAQGSATWAGPMVGMTRRERTELTGGAELRYHFGANQVDLTLDRIGKLNPADVYNGPPSLRWTGLRVNSDGSFFIRGYGNDRRDTDLHPTLGYVDGDFYGTNAEEVAGVFERSGIVGAFGGTRGN